MPEFPKLKTNAVAQYPVTRVQRFHNQIVQFVDGTEQRYRDSANVLRRWEITLKQLDAGELAALEAFFVETQGQYAVFSFTDPWEQQEYPNCSLENNTLELIFDGELQGSGALVIVENRG